MYLTGATNDRDEPALIEHGIGLMVQPGNGYHRRVDRYPFWGADNGAYSDKWEEQQWAMWLDALPRARCLFAVAPDVYPDAQATLERSSEYFDLIREMGFPVALVAQDGAEKLDLPWSEFDALFIGGEKKARDEWKISAEAEALCRRSRDQGKWVHMGRVNSLVRMQRARDMGCNSADGTFIKYRRRLRAREHGDLRDTRGALEVNRWITWLEDNPSLFDNFEMPSLPVHRAAATQVVRRDIPGLS